MQYKVVSALFGAGLPYNVTGIVSFRGYAVYVEADKAYVLFQGGLMDEWVEVTLAP